MVTAHDIMPSNALWILYYYKQHDICQNIIYGLLDWIKITL